VIFEESSDMPHVEEPERSWTRRNPAHDRLDGPTQSLLASEYDAL